MVTKDTARVADDTDNPMIDKMERTFVSKSE